MKIKRSEFIEKWIKALESGEYKQAQGVLRNDEKNRFCCLGVACDVANSLGSKDYFAASDGKLLPDSLAKFVGIEVDGGFKKEIRHRGVSYSSLTEMNDNGVGFKAIARIIRVQLAERNFVK